MEKGGNAALSKGHFQKSQQLLIENLQERPPIQNFQKMFIHFQWGIIEPSTGFCLWRETSVAKNVCYFWKITFCNFAAILFSSNVFNKEHCEKLAISCWAFICWVTFDRNLSKIMKFHVLDDNAQLLVNLNVLSCHLIGQFNTCFSQKKQLACMQLHAKDAESEISANRWNFFNITPYTTEDHVNWWWLLYSWGLKNLRVPFQGESFCFTKLS